MPLSAYYQSIYSFFSNAYLYKPIQIKTQSDILADWIVMETVLGLSL